MVEFCGFSVRVECVAHLIWYLDWLFFFFQAEDGIRDLVRSRGLGDVYKRQVQCIRIGGQCHHFAREISWRSLNGLSRAAGCLRAVSYTHLTLPTSDLV